MELLKGDCLQKDDELCDTCSSVENKWIGPATKCTPRPYQDPTQLPSYHNLKMKIHLHCTHVRMEAQEKWMITSLVPNYGNFSLRER